MIEHNEPAPDLAAFRADYRTRIERGYDGRAHLRFLAGVGLLGLASHVPRLLGDGTTTAVALGSVLAGFVTFDLGIYAVHRLLGHRPTRLGGLFYRRHQLDHHRFFLEDAITIDAVRDLRVVLFPRRLLLALVVFSHLAAWAVAAWSGASGAGFGVGLLAGYLAYEVVHLVDHLPETHPATRLPFLRTMRALHARHHRPGAPVRNYDIIVPFVDLLLGTYAAPTPRD